MDSRFHGNDSGIGSTPPGITPNCGYDAAMTQTRRGQTARRRRSRKSPITQPRMAYRKSKANRRYHPYDGTAYRPTITRQPRV